jgi:hypothetical protein
MIHACTAVKKLPSASGTSTPHETIAATSAAEMRKTGQRRRDEENGAESASLVRFVGGIGQWSSPSG